MWISLVELSRAGVLSEIAFCLRDQTGICGVRVVIDPWDVSDFEEVSLSRLRLAATREAGASLEIVCLESAVTQEVTKDGWLPTSEAFLIFATVSDNALNGDSEEESDERDNGFEAWR
jgi:hypothetical protein